jgi:hypothetical protein
MSLKQYMIVEEAGKKCLLLRFFNESANDVSAMELRLVQLDMSGEVIASSHIKVPQMKAHAGSTYSLKRGIVLNEHCVDFRITVLWVMSQGYKYVLRHNQMIPEYDVCGIGENIGPSESVRSFSKKIECPGRTLAAILSFGVILCAAALFVYYSARSFGAFGAAFDFLNSVL